MTILIEQAVFKTVEEMQAALPELLQPTAWNKPLTNQTKDTS